MKFRKDLVFKFYDEVGAVDDWKITLGDLRRKVSGMFGEMAGIIRKDPDSDGAGRVEFESAEEAVIWHLIELIMVYFALADKDKDHRDYIVNQILFHARALVRAIENLKEKK